jgi:outer membrane protein OmpA-like peptidoglycan-associated protein
VKRDRKRLRDRLVEERNIRRVELENESNIRRIEIDDEDFDDADQIEDDIFAAEAEDEEIEKVIIAPPKKKVRRVASVEELADKPDVRNSLRRIEIDTIRFGFSEAFVREEEIENLDEIALVIERVLKKYPREVFLIEGHTDAVGSDAYNLKLSKARAEAVKKALTSFYIIPSKNLKTVGLGER